MTYRHNYPTRTEEWTIFDTIYEATVDQLHETWDFDYEVTREFASGVVERVMQAMDRHAEED